MVIHDLISTAPILEWLPDELLFSLVSRLDSLWGHSQAGKTTEALFGSKGLGVHHDLPSGLSNFEEITQHFLGNAVEIARERTLLKFYRSFLPSSATTSIAHEMCGNSVAHLKFKLGLITSRFRANHPLKACPICMVEDQSTQGWAYWHLEHQYPGVWWCHVHECSLHESLFKSNGVRRFLWYMPCAAGLREWLPRGDEVGMIQSEAVASLSRTTLDLVLKGQQSPLFPGDFYKLYREALQEKGWLQRGRLRLTDMASDFVNYSARLRHIPEMATLPTTIDAAKVQLGRMLRKPRGRTHPLRHIILIDWLFGGSAEFLLAYQQPQNLREKIPLPTLSRGKNNEKGLTADIKRNALTELISQGKSIRSAALSLNVDINTAMEWAIELGHTLSRRPKVLKGDKRNLMIKMLRQGLDKQLVASNIGVSVVTVSRVLRAEPGLKSKWQILRFEQIRRDKRDAWLTLLNQYTHIGVKLLRSMKPAVYTWLYRNDRDWLREHSPYTKESPGNNAHNGVAWDKRDIELSKEVEKTALNLFMENPYATIRLWQLYQRIPELKAKLDVLSKLPLTQRAIEKALNKSHSSKQSNDDLF